MRRWWISRANTIRYYTKLNPLSGVGIAKMGEWRTKISNPKYFATPVWRFSFLPPFSPTKYPYSLFHSSRAPIEGYRIPILESLFLPLPYSSRVPVVYFSFPPRHFSVKALTKPSLTSWLTAVLNHERMLPQYTQQTIRHKLRYLVGRSWRKQEVHLSASLNIVIPDDVAFSKEPYRSCAWVRPLS